MSTTTHDRPTDRSPGRASNPAFSALIGLCALAVLLQGVWAGIFLQHEGSRSATWVSVHAHGSEAALALAVLATVVGFWKLRGRRDLWIGSAVLTVLLVLESFLGGLISGGSDWATIIHIPLAMALMGLLVWLPLRSRGRA